MQSARASLLRSSAGREKLYGDIILHQLHCSDARLSAEIIRPELWEVQCNSLVSTHGAS